MLLNHVKDLFIAATLFSCLSLGWLFFLSLNIALTIYESKLFFGHLYMLRWFYLEFGWECLELLALQLGRIIVGNQPGPPLV